MIFETNRIIVRDLMTDDLIPFTQMQENKKVMKYITGSFFTPQESAEQLNHIIDSKGCDKRLVWAVIRKEDQCFIGTCALLKLSDEETELGYRFDEMYWGHGYGKEVGEGLVRYATDDLNRPCLVSYVEEENKASIKILEHLNFEWIDSETEENIVTRRYRLKR